MNIEFENLLKEQIIFLLLPIIAIVLFLGGLGYTGYTCFDSYSKYSQNVKKIDTLTKEKNDLEAKWAQQQKDDQDPSMKKVLELEGVKFGADASFAPLFENMLNVARATGLKFRSISYNYAPEEDPIFASKLPGYNTCEVETTVVGRYDELQSFLKTLLSENYLINIAGVEIVSWQRDKRILIANLKIRFYTKTS